MPQYTLQQISQITGGEITGDRGRIIDTLEIDSRKITNKDTGIFIAIRGIRHDGHRYIEDLYQQGLRNFLIDNSNFNTLHYLEANFILVHDAIVALQKIAAAYRAELKMPIIGITGSNGKTVVKEWLFQCLSHSGIVGRSPKSYNSQIGVPLSVWSLNPAANWSIIEAGISLPGEMCMLEPIITPDIGIITNIGNAHQENFTTLENKTKEKLILFKNSKIIFYCRDHEIIHSQLTDKSFANKQLISWSKKFKDCFLTLKHTVLQDGKCNIGLVVKKNNYELTLPFTDEASIENCLHIITFLFYYGYPTEYIQHTIGQLTAVAMRLEQIKGKGNCTLINDSYNSDLNSLKIAMDYLALQKQHKKHALILSDIQQTGLSKNDLYGEVVQLINSYKIDKLIVIGKEIASFAKLPERTFKFGSTSDYLNKIASIAMIDYAILIKGAREFGFEEIVKALSDKKHTTVLEINLNNLVHNLNYFRGLLKPQTKIMVMVKALSYGSGGYEISNLLQHEKVDYLGVAFTDEGVELRKAGITLPIMVMSPTDDAFEDILEYNLEPEIYSFSGLRNFSNFITLSQLTEYPVHLKLDSGMHRLGFMPEDIPELLQALDENKNIKIKAVFSHLAVADNKAEDAFTKIQINRFDEMFTTIADHLGYSPIRHMLNSAGIERFPEAQYDMVRLGIGLHGVSSIHKDLKPVSRLKTKISQIKKIMSSETVGYNRRGRFDADAVIAIIPIGYADGLDRKLGNRVGYVLVGEQKASYIGNICMDMSMIDITGLSVKEGDEVIIFGPENPIQNLAFQIGTIPYEVLTSVSSRVKRIYINE